MGKEAINKKNGTKDIMIKFLNSIHEEIQEADAVLFREVTPIGNSGHITIPKEYIGKYARVIITSRKNIETVEMKKVNPKEDSSK